jgi:hypothetical protein
MRKILLLLVGTAVLWLPAVSVAGDSSSRPPRLAVEKNAREARGDAVNPASTCSSQRSGSNSAARHNAQTFTHLYGTNRGKGNGAGANAFGKCVSTIAKHKAGTEREDTAEGHDKDAGDGHDNRRAESDGRSGANPAMTCKTMRANDLARFQATYGSRPSAFGKCVAGHANGKKR